MLFGRVISVGIGYLCGMFLSGFLYGKKENVDLRKVAPRCFVALPSRPPLG